MRLHDIFPDTTRQKAKRVGRGISAGQGKTAGRGTKGQNARTGASSKLPRTFRGGSTPLVQSLPKMKGFTSHRVKPLSVNIARIAAQFESGSTVTLNNLIEKHIITAKEAQGKVKIVGNTQTKAAYTFEPPIQTTSSLKSSK